MPKFKLGQLVDVEMIAGMFCWIIREVRITENGIKYIIDSGNIIQESDERELISLQKA